MDEDGSRIGSNESTTSDNESVENSRRSCAAGRSYAEFDHSDDEGHRRMQVNKKRRTRGTSVFGERSSTRDDPSFRSRAVSVGRVTRKPPSAELFTTGTLIDASRWIWCYTKRSAHRNKLVLKHPDEPDVVRSYALALKNLKDNSTLYRFTCPCDQIVVLSIITGEVRGEDRRHTCETTPLRETFFEAKKWMLIHGSQEEIEEFEKMTASVCDEPDYTIVRQRDWVYGTSGLSDKHSIVFVREEADRNFAREYFTQSPEDEGKVLYKCVGCLPNKTTHLVLDNLAVGIPAVWRPPSYEHAATCEAKSVVELSMLQGNKIADNKDMDILRVVPRDDFVHEKNRLIVRLSEDRNLCYEYEKFNNNATNYEYCCRSCQSTVYNACYVPGGAGKRGRALAPIVRHKDCEPKWFETTVASANTCSTPRDVNIRAKSAPRDVRTRAKSIPRNTKPRLESTRGSTSGSPANRSVNSSHPMHTHSKSLDYKTVPRILKNMFSLNKRNTKLVIRKEGDSDRGYRFMVQGDDDISTRHIRKFFKCVSCKCLAYYTLFAGSSTTVRTFMDHEANCTPFPLSETDLAKIQNNEKIEEQKLATMRSGFQTPYGKRSMSRSESQGPPPPTAKIPRFDPVPQRTSTPKVEPPQNSSFSMSWQISNLLPGLDPPQVTQFSRPSDVWFTNSCRALKIDQSSSDDPYGVWYRLKKFDLQMPVFPPIMDTKSFSSGFGLIAYLVAADESKGDAVKEAINVYFFNNYKNFGIVDGTDCSTLAYSEAVKILSTAEMVPVHFISLSQLLKCTVVLYDYVNSKRLEYQSEVSDSPTMVIGFKMEGYFLFIK